MGFPSYSTICPGRWVVLYPAVVDTVPFLTVVLPTVLLHGCWHCCIPLPDVDVYLHTPCPTPPLPTPCSSVLVVHATPHTPHHPCSMRGAAGLGYWWSVGSCSTTRRRCSFPFVVVVYWFQVCTLHHDCYSRLFMLWWFLRSGLLVLLADVLIVVLCS
jgi:hypothetical protein